MAMPDLTQVPAVPVYLSGPDLRRALLAVIPFADQDPGLPSLDAVRLELRNGTLLAIATDRYTLAVASCPVRSREPVADCGTLIGLDRAADLAAVLADIQPGTVLIGISPGLVTVEMPARPWTTPARELEWAVPWRDLAHKQLTAPPAVPGDEYGLNPAHLARFTLPGDATAGRPDEPLALRWTQASGRGARPVMLAARGDWFLAVVVPVRLAESSRDRELVAQQVEGNWASWAALTGGNDA